MDSPEGLESKRSKAEVHELRKKICEWLDNLPTQALSLDSSKQRYS